MASDLKLSASDDRPLVGDVEFLGDPKAGRQRDREDRDESILRMLRDKLHDREEGNAYVTRPARPRAQGVPGEEDKYEPQRLSRKICWQYDSAARKVPLLRRHYI